MSVDNRPEAIAQRQLANEARNGPYLTTQRRQLQGMFGKAAQRKGKREEEKPLQGKFATVQSKGPDDEELQKKADPSAPAQLKAEPAAQANNTGLPNGLKSGIESLSGLSLDGVKVHYNSAQPAQLNALAYAQGSDIHVAPGQEQHLPHEAWHVVQQAQGRVRPTMQMKDGVPVNDDQGLEREADVMGARALASPAQRASGLKEDDLLQGKFAPVQRFTEEKRIETDSRMDELYAQTVALLTKLMEEGTDWRAEYSAKGKEKGKEKAKSVLSGKKSDPTSEIIREGLSQYWATLEPQEKAELVYEAVGAVTDGARLLPSSGLEAREDRSGKGKKEKVKEKEKEKPRKPRESGEKSSLVPSSKWLSELTAEDLETMYDIYKAKRDLMNKIAKVEEAIVNGVGDVGEFVGSTAGGARAEAEFNQLIAAHKQDFIVARKRYQFLQAAIASNGDADRYQAEMDALDHALMNAIHGPASAYSRDLNETARRLYPEKCETALLNLRASHQWRSVKSSVSSAFSFVGSGIKSVLGGSKEAGEALTAAQNEMDRELYRVANKSWRKFTGSVFVWTPTGVGSIREALTVGAKPTANLAKARKAASEARARASEDRDPMTQIFYDAVSDIKLDDINNLNKSISIIQEVGAKLG